MVSCLRSWPALSSEHLGNILHSCLETWNQTAEGTWRARDPVSHLTSLGLLHVPNYSRCSLGHEESVGERKWLGFAYSPIPENHKSYKKTSSDEQEQGRAIFWARRGPSAAEGRVPIIPVALVLSTSTQEYRISWYYF